jgi:leucyl-tRNA synthetase
MKRYDPKKLEPKWQQYWADNRVYEVHEDSLKKKSYIIDMFPYPSGAGLHVGHVRNFTISDTITQYHRQKGENVLHTMGWDAFGLPAENYAIKTGIAPAESIKVNIRNFKKQLEMLGMSYDWSREINTTDPEYYRWTQWIFNLLYKNKLAYQAQSLQWWCPHDKTVLANEQVINGHCWRCGHKVIKKSLNQWFFKITEYADQLLEGIDDLMWPEKIKAMQTNWIGRSEGMLFTAPVKDTDLEIDTFSAHFEAFGADTFVVIAPDHPRLAELIEGTKNKQTVLDFAKKITEKRDETGYENEEEPEGIFTGRYVIDPVGNGDLPIWVANYAIATYGTGIVKCSAHDERDFRFAKKYGITLKPVLFPIDDEEARKVANLEYCFSDMKDGVLSDPKAFEGRVAGGAREEIIAYLEHHHLAVPKVSYKIHDWLISRQRYWGAPIPIIHCPDHGSVPVPDDQLPVVLPEVKQYQPTGEGTSVLASVEDWVNTTCPICDGPAKRETDTMDGYACSSWYYLRYTDPNNNQRAWDPDKANYWLPIDYYCGGDHAVSHLLYSRFWMYFFADQGLIEKSKKEPVGRLVYNGYINAYDGQKMSKSKGNVVNPDELIEQGYGADALRVFELFVAPYEQDSVWNTNGVPGCYRFLNRVWVMTQEFLLDQTTNDSGSSAGGLLRASHLTIKKVTEDLDALRFNTAVASLMEYVNSLYKIKAEDNYSNKADWKFALTNLVLLLAPFAPHISEELWEQLGGEGSVHVAGWPKYEKSFLDTDVTTIVIQVNGKLRDRLEVPRESREEKVLEAVLSSKKIQTLVEGREIIKKIYVPNKLVNLVVK